MGAWGKGNFENDSALDWVYELTETDNLSLVVSTIKQVVQSQKPSIIKKVFKTKPSVIEEPIGSETLAAAEVVAAINGNPCADFPEELGNWVHQHQALEKNLNELAREAINLVKRNSELRELWEESDEYSEWIKVLEGLENRLRG